MKRKIYIILVLAVAISLAGLYVSGICRVTATKQIVVKKEIKQKEEGKTEAIDALQFISRSRAFPNADVPGDAYGKAWSFYQTHYLNTKEDRMKHITSGGWTNFGPNNVGGRTLSIAIDPTNDSVVYMGSASGGLWKSITGGIGVNAWTYIPTGFPVLGVASIAINPSNHNEIYIGTGETYDYGTSLNGLVDRTTRGCAGIGILKSTDGGITWRQSLNWMFLQNCCVWDIIFNPLNTKSLYAATTEGVFKTLDSGATWTNVLNQQMVTDMVIHKVDTNIVFAGVGNLNSANKGLYTTTNSGGTWSVVGGGLPANTQNGRIIVSNYATNNDIMMCEVCNDFSTVGIFTSINKGVTWTPVSPPTEVASWQGWYARGLLMQPGNHNNVIMGGVYLFGSSSFGNNLSEINPNIYHSDIHNIIADPMDSNKIFVITDGGLFRSDDFGGSFYDCNDGYVSSQLYIGAVSSTNASLAIAGFQDNYTNQYNNSVYWNSVIGGDGTSCAIDNTNDQVQYGCYQYMNVYMTYDAWTFSTNYVLQSPSNANGGNPAAFMAPLALCPSNNNYLYTGGDSLVVTNDGGITWNSMGPIPLDNGNVILSIGVSSTSTDTVFCGTVPNEGLDSCHIFRSYDGGNSFTNITGTLPNRYPRQITVNPSNSREVYIAYSGFGSGHLFKSQDAGHTWTDISTTLPDIPFHCIMVDPYIPNNLYAGCDFGVFASYDDGATWTALDNGFPDVVMVFDLVYSPADRTMLAFTHGHGAYRIALPSPAGLNPAIPTIASLNVYPNPARSSINISIQNNIACSTKLSLYDMQGKLILSKQESFAKGINIININCANLASGSYLLVSDDGTRKVTKKIAVISE
jgi:photosystem II stability/assembly factor-like uncharacterized protein